MTDKEVKVAEFNASNHFHQCALNALAHVMTQNPTTLMLVFELPDGQVGAAAVPASKVVAKGLADAVYGMLWVREIQEHDEDEEGIVE